MMKDYPTNFEQFEALLQQKHYDDLSEKEKGIVAEYCDSSQEYHLMRKMVLAQAPNIMAPKNVPRNLLEKVAENAKPSVYQRFMNFKVPFWVYLLSLFTVLGLMYFGRPNSIQIKEVIKEVPKEIIKEVPKEIIKTDTVVQYAFRVDTIYLPSKKSSSRATVQHREAPEAAFVNQIIEHPKQPVKKNNQQPVGRTIKQDPDLKVFFTEAFQKF